MAGEYVRWLARDVKPVEKKELTPEEKRRNWWAYHKWYVLIGVAGLILGANLVFDAVSNVRAAPDYTITYVGSAPLAEGVAPALEECIAELGEDLNGNGQVQVEVLEFLLREGEAATVFGDSLQLTLNIESGESVLYLLEDPELFAETYPILCLFYMLTLIRSYRLWSADPQLHAYCFQLLAMVLLLLCSFHRTCCDAGVIQRRKLLLTAMTAAVCCAASLSGGFQPGFFLGSGLWAMGCACDPAVLPPDPEEEEGQEDEIS